jgi:hypothetical protein
MHSITTGPWEKGKKILPSFYSSHPRSLFPILSFFYIIVYPENKNYIVNVEGNKISCDKTINRILNRANQVVLNGN